ncbi:hypothetical protein, partial [Aeromonas dhakensis]|uniref:hypothetical protein n=3 Tax=Aeromonas TaxID=642 RepID=UPI001FCC0BBF
MKYMILSLLLSTSISAAEQDYKLIKDEWVDGNIDKNTSSSSTILAQIEGNIISPGSSGDNINGAFMEDNKL